MNYEKYFVCFFDILGFKNMIIESQENSDVINKISNVLLKLEQLKSTYNTTHRLKIGCWQRNAESSEMTSKTYMILKANIFSDSLIITYKCEKPRMDFMDIYIILNQIGLFTFQLLGESIFIRGGIAYGDLYHEKDVCFGPALVEAVELEKKAVYPRIAVSDTVISWMESNCIENKNSKNNYEFIIHEIMGRDLLCTDKIYFLDYLYMFMTEQNSKIIKNVICNQLNNDYDNHIIEKYVWLAFYYNMTINSIPLSDVEYITDKRIRNIFGEDGVYKENN